MLFLTFTYPKKKMLFLIKLEVTLVFFLYDAKNDVTSKIIIFLVINYY